MVIYLIGFPASGKYTIAQEICAQDSNFKLVDNHLINNPIFNVIRLDGITKIPAGVWDNISKIRDAVLDTLVNYSEKEANFVLTNVLLNGQAEDEVQYNCIKDMAAARGAKFVPVVLNCNVEEMLNRVGSAERATRHKISSKEALKDYTNKHELLNIEHENVIKLDNTNLSAHECAKKILDIINDCED